MPTCAVCGTANPDGFRFCGSCGVVLSPSACPACGAAHEQGQRYCGSCGATLQQAVPPGAEAPVLSGPQSQERKLATVLFADVVGFTSLSERTDPEVVARMVDAAFRQLGEVVSDHGGTIDKYMGDSLMAVFGVPFAHDDDAERAIAAGLAMRRLGGDLVFSIGINSGEVMVTPVGRSGEVTVIGDAVNVAARLEKTAGPGEVLCGALTAELVGRRGVFRSRQPVVLKGKADPVTVWEAVSLRAASDDGADGSAIDDPPLVGRSGELGYLESVWQRTRNEGVSQVVLLCGEAGSGKTRLVSELARGAAADGLVVRASYPSYGAMGAARVAKDVLVQLGPAGDAEISKRVHSLAGKPDESLQGIDPASLRQEQTWAFARLLEEKASAQPLLIAIDDMHRSAEANRKLLVELGRRAHRIPLMLVLAGRSDPGAWLSQFPGATTVRLEALGTCDAAMLARAFVCDGTLSDEAADFFAARARGNPLYLRELVSVARAEGALAPEPDGLHLARPAAVPATLQALLAARLDSLERAQKTAFQYVAVLGEAATAAHLRDLGVADADAALRVLVDSGLVRRRPGGVHEAVDPLLSEVAYETLPRHVRGELHRRAAAVAPSADERARHMDRAADYLSDDDVATEAAGMLAAVGEEFAAEARHADALRMLERAVALGCRSPSALFTLAELQDVFEDGEAARATLELVADDPDDPSVAVRRDHALAAARVFTDPATAGDELAAIAGRWAELGNRSKEAWAYANRGLSFFQRNEMDRASELFETALAMFEELGDRAGVMGTTSFLCLARPTDSRVPKWMAEALEFAEEVGDRVKQVNALMPLAWHYFLRSTWGDPQETAEAEGFARRLAEVAEDFGGSDLHLHGRCLLALIFRLTGRLQEAAAQAAEVDRRLGTRAGALSWLGWATSFSVAVAAGATQAAPPFPPDTATEPIAEIAGWVVASELMFAGRGDEDEPRFLMTHLHGTVQESYSVLHALCLVQMGRSDEALAIAATAARAARVLQASPLERAARALVAEISGDPAGLPSAPESAGSVSDLLVLRAHAALGDESALDRLREGSLRLAMPALAEATGVSASAPNGPAAT